MIEDNIEVNVNNTIEVIDVFPQITEEVVDINLLDNREDVLINVTESIIEVNINKVTNILSAVWGSITGTLSDQTDLQSALNAKQDDITLTVIGSSGSSTLVGSTLNVPTYSLAGLGGVSGSGTTNYVPKFTGSTSIGNSLIYDNGTNVGIGTTYPATKTHFLGGGTTTSIANAYNTVTSRFDTANPAVSFGIGYVSADIPMLQSFNSVSNVALNLTINPYGGNIGIGTTAFNLAATGRTLLSLSGANSNLIELQVAGTNQAYIYNGNAGNLEIYGYQKIDFGANGSTRMTITSGGNVGIGTTASVRRLEVASDGSNWISGTFSGSGGTDKVVIGNLGNTATIGGHTSALTAWANLALSGSQLLFQISGTEKMRLDASGNLGIGTTSPATKLDISYADNTYLAGITVKNTTNAGAAQAKINIQNSAGNILALFQNSPSVNSGTAYIGTSSTHALTLGTDYLETMRIVNNNVGIGTTSPTSKLDILNGIVSSGRSSNVTQSNIYFQGYGYVLGSSLYGNVAIGGSYNNTNNYSSLDFYTTGGSGFNQKMIISPDGSVGIGTTSPTRKLDITAVPYAANQLGGLRISNSNNTTFSVDLLYGISSIGASYASLRAPNDGNGWLDFWTNGAEKMRLTAGGSVGIGTTSPSQKLHVSGGIRGEYYSSVNNKGLNQIVDFIDLDNVRYQMTFEDGILVGYVVT